jgi:HSP20 family protein
MGLFSTSLVSEKGGFLMLYLPKGWGSIKELDFLPSRLSRFFEQEIAPFFTSTQKPSEKPYWVPPIDVAENPSGFLLRAELPDVEKDGIHVQVRNSKLLIHGERNFEKPSDDSPSGSERVKDFFYRSFPLPENIDREGIQATFKEGALLILLPKAPAGESRKPQEIRIR